MRHAHAEHRQRRGDAVHPGIAKVAGDEAEQAAEQEADEGGHAGEHQGIADGAHHFGGDRPARGDRGAEVAVQRTPEPGGELLEPWPIEAVQLHQLLLQLDRGIGRQDGDQRIAGRDMHQQEAEKATPIMIGIVTMRRRR